MKGVIYYKYCCGYKYVLLFTQKENYMNIVK